MVTPFVICVRSVSVPSLVSVALGLYSRAFHVVPIALFHKVSSCWCLWAKPCMYCSWHPGQL